ncbi:MAG: hypothetical protein KKE20_07335 [Nanoarchaeota archaeon]|nr:hypothetical protein [Nanoarchaeota archaeon]
MVGVEDDYQDSGNSYNPITPVLRPGTTLNDLVTSRHNLENLGIDARGYATTLTSTVLDVVAAYIQAKGPDKIAAREFQDVHKHIYNDPDVKNAITAIQLGIKGKIEEGLEVSSLELKADFMDYVMFMAGDRMFDDYASAESAAGGKPADPRSSHGPKRTSRWKIYTAATLATIAALLWSGPNCLCGPGYNSNNNNKSSTECPSSEDISSKIKCGCPPGEEQSVTYDPKLDIYTCLCSAPEPVIPEPVVVPGSSTEPPVPPKTYQCSDGKDNDGDRKIDSKDPGCRDRRGRYNPEDDDEYNRPPVVGHDDNDRPSRNRVVPPSSNERYVPPSTGK